MWPPICRTRPAQVCATRVPWTCPVVVAVRGCLHGSGSETRFQAQHLGFVDHPCDVTPRLQPCHVPRQRRGVLVACRPGEMPRPSAARCRPRGAARSGPQVSSDRRFSPPYARGSLPKLLIQANEWPVAPMPGSPASISVTSAPRRARWNAIAPPTIPAPMTATRILPHGDGPPSPRR